MAISNNSIVHYTKEFDTLRSILLEGFRLKFCCEILESKIPDTQSIRLAIPMVSFCDLPLSQIHEHVEKYGRYGIGLSKAWARRYRMNPVLYFDQESSILGVYLIELADELLKFDKKSSKQPTKLLNNLLRFFLYSKNYEGVPIRPNKLPELVRFYNEREWRFVPLIEDLKEGRLFHLVEEYQQNKDVLDRQLEHIKLVFPLDEISYIIVSTAKEADQIAKFIQDVYYDHATQGQITRAITKIFTQDQIQHDF